MRDQVKKAKRQIGLGLVLAGAAFGVGALAAAVFRQRKREQVYHEAEIKAMNELDDLMAEDEGVCAACEGLEECETQGGCSAQEQLSMAEEAPAAPAETAPQPE